MGNAQSASSARQDSAPPRSESSDGFIVATPHHSNTATSQSGQTPADTEESGVSRRTVGRRRSLMKLPSFSSLRKRRSVAEIGVEDRDGSVNASPSRRRWRRASNGRKSRPVSTKTDANTPAVHAEPPSEAPIASISEHSSSEKGKGRELTEQVSTESEQPETSAQEPIEKSPLSADITDRDEPEDALSSDAKLRDLRELQDSLSTDDDPTSMLGTPNVADNENQAGRPPTPIPTSALDPGPISRDAGGDSGTDSVLAEALGSWMSGRSPGVVQSSTSNFPAASGSHSHDLGSSTQPFNAGDVSSSFDPSMPGVSPHGSERRTAGATRSTPSLSPPPVRPANGRRIGPASTVAPPQQERRTLAPAGTGTLVVVQGVVHTTDVRNSRAHSPSHFPTQSAPMHPPRSSSSTPTLRATPRHLYSRSPSHPSTPQPQSQTLHRRGRFSSLTNSLRPRSRFETSPSRRSGGPAGIVLGGANANETASASGGSSFDSSVDSSASETENTSSTSSTSSAIASTPIPDTPVGAALHADSRSGLLNTTDDLRLLNQSSTHTVRDITQPTGDEIGTSANDDNNGNEEESEAELSASSIEVLGTLLSVATAATAASLVTGTTDPLFSSGLTGTNFNSANRDASPIQSNSNTGPPSPSTQDVRSSTSLEPDINNNNAEAAVNTRMRAAWESLRDRFSRARGRRGAAAGSADEREDPREQMLREMARAFNTGLGLDSGDDIERPWPGDNEGSHGAVRGNRGEPNTPYEAPFSDGGGRPTREQSPGPGLEGSFERFLHNLQVDLRTALTEDYAARRARAHTREARSAVATSLSNSPTQTSATDAEALSPDVSNTISSHQTPEDSSSSNGASFDGDHLPLASTVPTTPRPATLDLPSILGDTGTSSDRSGVSNGPPQAHGITGQPGPGINWWRLYRFPAMQVAPHPVVSPTDGIPTTPDSPVSTERPISSPARPTASGRNLEADHDRNVVPVIVVGLQSVTANRDGDHHPHHHYDHDSPSPFGNNPLSGDSDLPRTRERAWPLRAASRAFGRLGRRNDAESFGTDGTISSTARPDLAGAQEGRQGGRTYLIFVIGGYYPPNHSIVTGSDDMNSFEALWDLAELLGQVRPPVASKEDIEKSGLEVIKASSLSDYERAGKVASNTTERCLICLDDYEHEDDLRLLSCRHVFHKQCVDKWLEQGRNNCPACRTKGVRTGDEVNTSVPA